MKKLTKRKIELLVEDIANKTKDFEWSDNNLVLFLNSIEELSGEFKRIGDSENLLSKNKSTSLATFST